MDPTTVPGRIAFQNFDSTVTQIEGYLKKFHQNVAISADPDWDKQKAALKTRAEKALTETSSIIDEMRELTGLLEVDVQELPKLDENTVPGRIQINTIQNTVEQLKTYLAKLQA